jgi:hypothetical protein
VAAVVSVFLDAVALVGGHRSDRPTARVAANGLVPRYDPEGPLARLMTAIAGAAL